MAIFESAFIATGQIRSRRETLSNWSWIKNGIGPRHVRRD